MHNQNTKAFTLVELAIVLIVIGLITGGVVGAQSLIESTNIHSEINNIEKLRTAIRAFKLEYDSIPGDMTDAYDYFGDACGNDSTDNMSGCNGDGDKCIDQSPISNCSTGGSGWSGDIRRAFVHLAVSEIMPEIEHTINRPSVCNIGEVLPAMSIGNNATYMLHSNSNTQGKIFLYMYNRSVHAYTCASSGTDAFRPKNVSKIDKKTDDGNGRLGIVQARVGVSSWDNYSGTDCIDSSGNYVVSNNGFTCGMRIDMD